MASVLKRVLSSLTRQTQNVRCMCVANMPGAPTDAITLASNTQNKIGYDKSQSGILSQKIEVNGIRLHFKISGIGDHVLLLCPGALGSTRTDFAPQMDLLDKRLFTLVAWDPRGYGKSIPPVRDWPIEFLQRDADDGAELMEKIGHKKYSVLGWSDGGITGMIIAARQQNKVKKLVMWGANAFVCKEDMDIFEKIRDVDKWSPRMREPFVNLYGDIYFREQWSQWVDAYGRYLSERKGDICMGDLENILCPTLIVHGVKDPMVMEWHPKYLQEHIKNVRRLDMPEGKHNLHLRYPEEFNKIVTDFLLEKEENK